jgi:phage terminase small subunit
MIRVSQRVAVAKLELDKHHLQLLEAACQAWDRMMQARAALAEHGLTYIDAKGDFAFPFPRRQSCKDQPIAFRRAC